MQHRHPTWLPLRAILRACRPRGSGCLRIDSVPRQALRGLVPRWLGSAHGFESDNLVSFRISNFLCDYLILLHFFDVLMRDTYGLMDLLVTTA